MRVPKLPPHRFHQMHQVVHLGYFAAVFIEAHGFYGALGGMLFVVGVVGLFVGDAE